MKKVGVWMDRKKAHIIRIIEEVETFETLSSNIEFFNPKGGSRSKAKWGPQDVVQDSKYLEREKNQLKSYFDDLAQSIKNADMIVLFGPSDTAEKFSKELSENHKSIAAKVQSVIRVDSLTDNQVRALVRDFYKTAN